MELLEVPGVETESAVSAPIASTARGVTRMLLLADLLGLGLAFLVTELLFSDASAAHRHGHVFWGWELLLFIGTLPVWIVVAKVHGGDIERGSYLLVESLDRLSRDQVLEALGVFTSIINAGIVIDRVGGCSMGSFIGAQFAAGSDPEATLVAAKPDRMLRDLGEIVELMR